MESERNTIIYSFKHETIRTMIRKIEEIEGIDDDECPEDFLPTAEEILSEYGRSYKPVYRKLWAKKRFIKKAKLLARHARFDIEIQEDPHCIVVRYQIETAFLLPRSHALFGGIIKMSDDMIIFPPAEGSEQMTMVLYYRTHK